MNIAILILAITVSFAAGHALAWAVCLKLLRAALRDGTAIAGLALEALPEDHPKRPRLQELLLSLARPAGERDSEKKGTR